MRRIWPHVVRAVGGVHMIGRLWIVIHDGGAAVAWRQIERWRWQFLPPEVYRNVAMRLHDPHRRAGLEMEDGNG